MSATVVIIDDSLTVRKVAERQLRSAGFAVIGAATGQEGIDAARQHRPDLLLLDFMLPDMKGTDVCASLSRSDVTSGIPIIVLSGRDAGQLRNEFSSVAAVKACIEKPFGADLAAQVRSVITGIPKTSPMTHTGAQAPSEVAAATTASSPMREASARARERQASFSVGAPRKASTTTNDQVGKIVDEILSVLDRSPESRRVMLRIIVRRYLTHDR